MLRGDDDDDDNDGDWDHVVEACVLRSEGQTSPPSSRQHCPPPYMSHIHLTNDDIVNWHNMWCKHVFKGRRYSCTGAEPTELFGSLGTEMDQPVEREWELKIPGLCDLMLLFRRIIGDEHWKKGGQIVGKSLVENVGKNVLVVIMVMLMLTDLSTMVK